MHNYHFSVLFLSAEVQLVWVIAVALCALGIGAFISLLAYNLVAGKKVGSAKEQSDKIIKDAGDNACNAVGIYNLNTELVKILGRLKYRTSYGQNCLKHSIETSIIVNPFFINPLSFLTELRSS